LVAIGMTEPDALIHQALRLRIMASLNAARPDALDFNKLKAVTGATDGNLGSHLTTLETAGYVRIEKIFVGKRPKTQATITRAGERAFRAHLDFLREVIDAAQE
jgi:DNA-binding MarR family transcriptional regulator